MRGGGVCQGMEVIITNHFAIPTGDEYGRL